MTRELTLHEVERRYSIQIQDLTEIKEKLAALQFKHSYHQHQVDEYFTSKHKDFISSEECLRIRSTDGRTFVTWKPPTSSEMRKAPDFWKREIEFPVDAQSILVRQFLEALDFTSYVIVEKNRTAYTNAAGIEVSIDRISEIGTFIEIEIKSTNVDCARQELATLAKNLHLDDEHISAIPYRDLVAAHS